MGKLDLTKPTEQPVLSEADVERIVDALERRRMLILPDPVPVPVPEVSPRQVDLDDLIVAKEGAYLVGKHERTIQRWMLRYDICEVVAGANVLSRRKLLAHAALEIDDDDDP